MPDTESDVKMVLSQDVVVRFKLHFLVTIVAALISVVIIFVNLRNDVIKALDMVAKQQVTIEQNQRDMTAIQLKFSIIELKLDTITDRINTRSK